MIAVGTFIAVFSCTAEDQSDLQIMTGSSVSCNKTSLPWQDAQAQEQKQRYQMHRGAHNHSALERLHPLPSVPDVIFTDGPADDGANSRVHHVIRQGVNPSVRRVAALAAICLSLLAVFDVYRCSDEEFLRSRVGRRARRAACYALRLYLTCVRRGFDFAAAVRQIRRHGQAEPGQSLRGADAAAEEMASSSWASSTVAEEVTPAVEMATMPPTAMLPDSERVRASLNPSGVEDSGP